MFVGEGINEYGTAVTIHRCDACGDQFSVCPAVEVDARDQWDGCLAESCASYEPMRDAGLFMKLGMVEVGDGEL